MFRRLCGWFRAGFVTVRGPARPKGSGLTGAKIRGIAGQQKLTCRKPAVRNFRRSEGHIASITEIGPRSSRPTPWARLSAAFFGKSRSMCLPGP